MAPTSVWFRSRRRSLAAALSVLGAAALAFLWLAAGARAAETIYWDNYNASPNSIGFADIGGSGGGALNLAGGELEGPEGMAYDSVSNRLFVASYRNDQIIAINLDGSGAASFAPPGAPIETPEGLTLDPATQMIYWINTASETISWAHLDGSSGGVLNTGGVKVASYRLAIDPVAGRLYWFQEGSPGELAYANTDNTGAGTLNTAGPTPATSANGIAVDPAGGRVYWLNRETNGVSYAATDGSGGGDVDVTGSTYNNGYGLAIDPSVGRLYWANYSNETEAIGAIGFASLAGGGGGAISIASAPVNGPQDPLVVKPPSGTEAPTASRSKGSRAALACSQGGWGADYPGSFVYQAPRTYAYQWAKNGNAVAGGAAATLNAKSAGKYSCTVTATNQAGSAGQTSAKLNVKAAKLKLTTKKKAKAKAGKLATFKVKAANQGDLKSGKARVCVKLAGKAKKALKRPKCKQLGKIAGGKKKATKLKLRVKSTADPGTYKVTFQVKGAPGRAAKAKVVVVG